MDTLNPRRGRDREGNPISVGDKVLLTEGMAINGRRKAVITKIDGSDVYVKLVQAGRMSGVKAHRYGSEMTLIKP